MIENNKILFIGDSITCGLALEPSNGGQPMPCGILDAFPAQALSMLRNRNLDPLALEVVAYPGICLVDLDQQNQDGSLSFAMSGMTSRFFHTTPWEPLPWTPRGSPHFIWLALGTNDEANDVSPRLFRSALEQFIRTLSSP